MYKNINKALVVLSFLFMAIMYHEISDMEFITLVKVIFPVLGMVILLVLDFSIKNKLTKLLLLPFFTWFCIIGLWAIYKIFLDTYDVLFNPSLSSSIRFGLVLIYLPIVLYGFLSFLALKNNFKITSSHFVK